MCFLYYPAGILIFIRNPGENALMEAFGTKPFEYGSSFAVLCEFVFLQIEKDGYTIHLPGNPSGKNAFDSQDEGNNK